MNIRVTDELLKSISNFINTFDLNDEKSTYDVDDILNILEDITNGNKPNIISSDKFINIINNDELIINNINTGIINIFNNVKFNNCNITKISNQAFYKYTNLTSIEIPNSVISIGKSAFSSCTGLTSISIPDSVTTIGDYTFNGCTRLTSITIPNSVTSIGNDIFWSCTSLTNVTIENGFNANKLDLSVSTKYTHNTILSWLNALYDRTGLSTYRLVIGSTNLKKLTNEEKAIATAKNWTLA